MVKNGPGIFEFTLRGSHDARRRGWAGYFLFISRLSMLLFLAALLVPWFRPVVEWGLPFLCLRALLAVMETLLSAAAAAGALRSPVLFFPLIAVLLALDFFVLPRLLKRDRGPVVLAGLLRWLKYTPANILFILAFDAFVVAYYAFLKQETAALLLAGAALLFAAKRFPFLMRTCSGNGILPSPGAGMMAIAAAACGTLIAGANILHHPAAQITAAAVFIWALARLLKALGKTAEEETASPPAFNARLLVFLLIIFTLFRGAAWMLSPGSAKPLEGLPVLANPGPVYDVLSVDGGRSVIFSPKMPGRLGRVDVSSRRISWSTERKMRVLMRMVYLKKLNSIVATTFKGLPVYNARTLAFERMLTNETFDYLAATGDGKRIYATAEPAPRIFILNTRTGETRGRRLGMSFVFWPYEPAWARDGRVFISHWITSPMLTRLDPGRPRARIRNKVHGFFNAGVALDNANKRVFLARTFFGRVDVLDMDTLRVVQEISSLFGTRELAYAPEQNLLFAPSFFTGDVQIIDLARGRCFVPFNAGRRVRSVMWEPQTRTLFMGSEKGIVMADWHTLSKILAGKRADCSFRTLPQKGLPGN